ncbi:MAG: DNA methyltransferase [Deltaproteobacteria bacterium]|nr:DNA methyltransferase [Deltaproteobacteria bacterium]
MAQRDIRRVELVWPGKFAEDGALREPPRVSLPFQVIERIHESRASREARRGGLQSGLFETWQGREGDTFEQGWKNKLIWGDNLLVMSSLLEKFAGKIDLIYIDPPFATGADFSFTAQIGESGEQVVKESSVIEEKAYRDTWGRGFDSYLTMIYERLVLMRELLSESGSIYVHCDWRVNSFLRLALDEIFGKQHLINEIIWCYTGPGSPNMKQFNRKHDTIFWFSKNNQWVFNKDNVRVPYKDPNQTLRKAFDSGQGMDEEQTEKYRERGKVPETWWEDIAVAVRSAQNLGYPTQKPEALLERIIKASSNEGDLVADFFCGSGTTAAVAEKLGRRWIACDLGRYAVHTTRKRMLGIENCRPFEVLNLGKYERQYWQGVTFGNPRGKPPTEQAIYDYLAFILKLYGAEPISGSTHLHGKKGRALVHIGAVDAPVSIRQAADALEECLQLKQKDLHILGWDWGMGMNDLVRVEAERRGVKLSLLQIPREVMEQQAAEKGDVQFFELAYLEAEIEQPGQRGAQVSLCKFVIPNTELIPAEIRGKISQWSDYIDYWAVDWDFRNDTFMQGWVAYRTRKERKLSLESEPHSYEKPGNYRILVKVIDIFGNDTTRAFDLEVK